MPTLAERRAAAAEHVQLLEEEISQIEAEEDRKRDAANANLFRINELKAQQQVAVGRAEHEARAVVVAQLRELNAKAVAEWEAAQVEIDRRFADLMTFYAEAVASAFQARRTASALASMGYMDANAPANFAHSFPRYADQQMAKIFKNAGRPVFEMESQAPLPVIPQEWKVKLSRVSPKATLPVVFPGCDPHDPEPILPEATDQLEQRLTALIAETTTIGPAGRIRPEMRSKLENELHAAAQQLSDDAHHQERLRCVNWNEQALAAHDAGQITLDGVPPEQGPRVVKRDLGNFGREALSKMDPVAVVYEMAGLSERTGENLDPVAAPAE